MLCPLLTISVANYSTIACDSPNPPTMYPMIYSCNSLELSACCLYVLMYAHYISAIRSAVIAKITICNCSHITSSLSISHYRLSLFSVWDNIYLLSVPANLTNHNLEVLHLWVFLVSYSSSNTVKCS